MSALYGRGGRASTIAALDAALMLEAGEPDARRRLTRSTGAVRSCWRSSGAESTVRRAWPADARARSRRSTAAARCGADPDARLRTAYSARGPARARRRSPRQALDRARRREDARWTSTIWRWPRSPAASVRPWCPSELDYDQQEVLIFAALGDHLALVVELYGPELPRRRRRLARRHRCIHHAAWVGDAGAASRFLLDAGAEPSAGQRSALRSAVAGRSTTRRTGRDYVGVAERLVAAGNGHRAGVPRRGRRSARRVACSTSSDREPEGDVIRPLTPLRWVGSPSPGSISPCCVALSDERRTATPTTSRTRRRRITTPHRTVLRNPTLRGQTPLVGPRSTARHAVPRRLNKRRRSSFR